jgi:hypothetical protein
VAEAGDIIIYDNIRYTCATWATRAHQAAQTASTAPVAHGRPTCTAAAATSADLAFPATLGVPPSPPPERGATSNGQRRPPAGTNNSQIADNSGVPPQPPPSGAPFLCPMPVCGRRGQHWSGDTKAQLLVHLRSKVHENERISHLILASIGAKYCGNCSQLMPILGRNHRCERRLGSHPQASSLAPVTPAALLAPAPQTANTALADRTPATPETLLDPKTSADRAPG